MDKWDNLKAMVSKMPKDEDWADNLLLTKKSMDKNWMEVNTMFWCCVLGFIAGYVWHGLQIAGYV